MGELRKEVSQKAKTKPVSVEFWEYVSAVTPGDPSSPDVVKKIKVAFPDGQTIFISPEEFSRGFDIDK